MLYCYALGEGLKVGALALLRCGQEVSMLTNNDSWRFRLKVDPTFQEKVLTIQITGRVKYVVFIAINVSYRSI